MRKFFYLAGLVRKPTFPLTIILVFTLFGPAAPVNPPANGDDQVESYSFVREWRFDTGTIGYDVGIATDPSGQYVYVTDYARHKILKFDANGKFIMEWGQVGSGGGALKFPTDVAVDSQGNVYVTEYSSGRVQKFTGNGTFLMQWEAATTLDSRIEGVAIELETDTVYVAATGSNRILRYSADGSFKDSIGESGMAMELSAPNDVALDGQGNVFVADSFNNRIVQFSNNGTFLTEWEKFDQFTDIWNPLSIAVDMENNFYVATGGIHKFDNTGSYRGLLGVSPEGEAEGGYALDIAVDNSNGYLYSVGDIQNGLIVAKYSLNDGGKLVSKWLPENPANDIIGSITSIKNDADGNLYIVDNLFSRIHKYSAEGEFLKAWGKPGSRNGELLGPTDIALDGSGNVYVVESDNRRVQKFSSNGQFIAKWGGGEPDSGEGKFYYPQSIAVDSEGRVFVSDIANQRISIFAADGTFIADWNSTALSASGPSEVFSQTGFHEARSLTFDAEDNLYMVDALNIYEPPYTFNRVAKFSPTQELLASWDSYDNEILSTSISSLAVDSENNVFVTDNLKNSVFKFRGDGTAITKWAYAGDGSGSSSQIGAITVDLSGIVYVADAQNSRLLVFGSEGSDTLADRAPTINVPPGEKVIVNATDNDSYFVNVTYDVTASDDHDADGSVIPSCMPPSGSSFAVGLDTTVRCVATDSAGNSASKSFIVSVVAPPRPEVELPEFKEQYGLVSSWGSAIDVNQLYLQAKAVAVDSNDNLYVLSYSVEPIQKYDRNGTSLAAWGALGSGQGQVSNPSGIAVDPTRERVYVTDSDRAKVVVFATNGTFVEEWGSIGSEDGQFSDPFGIAVDSDGFVYVVDVGNQRIQKFSPEGDFISKWTVASVDGNNTQPSEFLYPRRIAIQEGGSEINQTFVYVTDSAAASVQKFTDDGLFIKSWTSGQNPEAIAFDPLNTEVYVADFVGVGIDKYDDSGGYLATILNATNDRDGSTLFYNPTDIAIDSEGSIYVASSGPVLKFNSTLDLSLVIRYTHSSAGAFYDPFRIAIDQNTGNIHVADSGDPRIQTFNSSGSLLKQWEPLSPTSDDYLYPPPIAMSDMATNSEGIIYILAQKVKMFDRNGNYVGEWGSSGQDIDELVGPTSLAIDSADNVLIASAGDYSVKKFSADGQYLLGWKTDDPIANPDTASPPSNIAIDSSDNVYVLDIHFDKIKVYTPDGDFVEFWNNSLTDESEQAAIFDPYAPSAVAITIDKGDNVYLSYTGGHIRKFANNGTFLTDISNISNETQSYWLPDMAVNNDSGDLYIIDGTNSKIAVLSSSGTVVIPEFDAYILPILLIVSITLSVLYAARWKSMSSSLARR